MPSTPQLHRLTSFEPLREQLRAAAEAFATDAQPLGAILAAMVDDVERASREPLEIFPVCHHSPASALHVIWRLSQRPPRVIFMELCEDLRPLLDKLRDCKLPVALQAFAGQSDAFPKSWTPLSVVAPLTEFSAEYQAIAFALENPTTELVFVDRSVDHLFQWLPQEEHELEKHLGPDQEQEAPVPGEEPPPPMHGAALGVQVGSLEPTFEQFHEFLLKNAQVRYFAEWWDQYVEQAAIAVDYDSYRHVMFLVGSLLRRLGLKPEDREEDRQRERFMWTRMKDWLIEHRVDASDALHICGAIHAVSDIEEYGMQSTSRWEIPSPTATPWLYGLIPSSYLAIDSQFRLPHGTVTLADATWSKSQRALRVKPFVLQQNSEKPARPDKPKKRGKKVESSEPAEGDEISEQDHVDDSPTLPGTTSLLEYLTRPPRLASEDQEQLLDWCVGIVKLARRNGYLSTTADSIAIYHTSSLLAQLRNREHPTAYDFCDAAVTCLEKDRTPKKRNIQRLCEVLLGGDRSGQVGYSSLPPLAQNVYDRLAPLKVNLQSTTIQRALLDLHKQPELLPCSDLLWKLRYVLGGRTVRPIMGQRTLGHTPTQESWDIEIGKNQTPVISLGYEGVTVEHVLEKRLKSMAFAVDATPATALEAAEDCIVYLKSVRLTEEIGEHAISLLMQETGAHSAPEIFERVRRLVHHARSTRDGLPNWLKRFVTTGYSHYATLLPTAFSDRGTSPDQLAAMLAFLFTLESLALSLGCNRSQLVIAVQQAGPVTDDPNKLGLLWSAEWLLTLRTVESIREFFDRLLTNSLALPSFPAYIHGFLLALKFTPLVSRLVVELLSKAFAQLPNAVLMPWLPGLLTKLRPHAGSVLPSLIKEAGACFPSNLEALMAWQPPWELKAAAETAAQGSQRESGVSAMRALAHSPTELAVQGLLFASPDAANALCRLLGVEPTWGAPTIAVGTSESQTAAPTGSAAAVHQLLLDHPQAAQALAMRLLPTVRTVLG